MNYDISKNEVNKPGDMKQQQFVPGGFPQTPRDGRDRDDRDRDRNRDDRNGDDRGRPPVGGPQTGRPPAGGPQTGRPPVGGPQTGRPPVGRPPAATPPRTAPPSFTPQFEPARAGGRGFGGCLFRFTYIWMDNGNSFWFFPVFLGNRTLEGFRWRRNGWRYESLNLRRIFSFRCF